MYMEREPKKRGGEGTDRAQMKMVTKMRKT